MIPRGPRPSRRRMSARARLRGPAPDGMMEAFDRHRRVISLRGRRRSRTGPTEAQERRMKPFVVNRYGRIVFPFNFFPELDFSVFQSLEQFAAVIRRDFEEKAP